MENLETLELQLEENRQKHFEIERKIDAIKAKDILPKIKEKYEGKYWKYENSYNEDQKWWLYSFCVEAIDEISALFNSFETRPYELTFKIKEEYNFFICQIEITQEEYLSALNKFKSSLDILDNKNNF